MTSFKEYIGRMPASQEDIYYITVEIKNIVKHEAFIEECTRSNDEV